MSDITKATDEDIKKFLKGKVTVSGFSFENKVANVLKSEFSIYREEPYYDKEGKKGRTFDILARQTFPDQSQLDKKKRNSIAQLNLIIECKDISGNIWVFSADTLPGFSLPLYASMNYGKKDPAMNVIPKEPIKDIPYASAYTEYVFDEGRSNKQTSNLFSATTSITKAVYHQRKGLQDALELIKKWKPTQMNNMIHFSFFQPLVVFSGKLYIMKDTDNPEFESVKYVQMNTKYLSEDYKHTIGQIHIVSFDALPEYISMIKNYYRQNENILINYQKDMHDALKTVMPHLEE